MLQLPKRLYRARLEAQIAGICAGLGTYLNVDPVFVRLVTVAVTIMTGVVPGVLTYLAAWIIVPQEPLRLPRAHSDVEGPEPA